MISSPLIAQDCVGPSGATFYDSGGANGNYENNEFTSWTYCPCDGTSKVTVIFNEVDIEVSTGNGVQDGCWTF